MVRVTVHADGATVVREGHGTGEGRGTSPGEVHDIALKAAETDATKRALTTFGKPFGLELYRGRRTASQKPLPSSPVPGPADARLGFHPDDTTPIRRPSRYYGRRQNLVTRDRAEGRRNLEVQPLADTYFGLLK
jgi:Rad52/22 family double-strand break repair protein